MGDIRFNSAVPTEIASDVSPWGMLSSSMQLEQK
jgi:hypothetical protein